MILLDTHPLIWFTLGDERLGRRARETVRENIEAGTALLSPISFWEMSMLAQKNRIALGRPLEEWADLVLSRGIDLATLSPEIAIQAGQLLGNIHGDPADRLIIATARTLDCPLLTADHQIIAYGAEGHVGTIDARL